MNYGMRKFFFALLTIFIFFSGCTQQTEVVCEDKYFTPEPNNLENVPVANESLTIELDQRLGPYVIGDPLWFHLENHSDNSIVITLDQQLLILKATGEDNFEAVRNKTSYSGTPTLILGAETSEYPSAQLLLKPDIIDQGEPVELVVMIWGNLWKDGKYCDQLFHAQRSVLLQPD